VQRPSGGFFGQLSDAADQTPPGPGNGRPGRRTNRIEGRRKQRRFRRFFEEFPPRHQYLVPPRPSQTIDDVPTGRSPALFDHAPERLTAGVVTLEDLEPHVEIPAGSRDLPQSAKPFLEGRDDRREEHDRETTQQSSGPANRDPEIVKVVGLLGLDDPRRTVLDPVEKFQQDLRNDHARRVLGIEFGAGSGVRFHRSMSPVRSPRNGKRPGGSRLSGNPRRGNRNLMNMKQHIMTRF